MTEEDIIIASGLKLVRQGIIENNWELVCEGYNSISGENLQQKKKSRLESIRENLHATESLEVVAKTEISPKISLEKAKEKANQDIVGSITETKMKGGERFGKGEIRVISTELDPELQALNSKIGSKRPPAQKRETELEIFAKKTGLNIDNRPRKEDVIDNDDNDDDDK